MNAIAPLNPAVNGNAGPARPSTAPMIALIDRVLARIETSFLSAGTRLETAVDAIRQMQGLFETMQMQLSPEQAQVLLGLVSETKSNLRAIESEFDSFLAGSASLRAVVRAVRIEVEDLDRVVRTIANVSINARIQASRLNPPRPQVSAFLDRLSDMVEEAEASLAGVKSAMSGILDRMTTMDSETHDMQEVLKSEVLPTLARFAAQGQTVHDGQNELISTSAAIAGEMREIFTEVSRLVVGLQSGDAVRQRLERVREVLHHAESDQIAAADASVLLSLANRLALAAHTEAQRGSDAAIAEFGSVLDGARYALKTATDFYFGRSGERAAILTTGQSGESPMDKLLARLRGNLAQLGGLAGEVTAQVETILQQESRLRQISHQVRLSGLNAVLICAKLGEEGRSLRELAQWLRHLTDESDTIMGRLQGALDRTRAQLAHAGGDRIGHLETVLAGFVASATNLQDQLGGLDACLSGAVTICRETDRVLGGALGGAQTSMYDFRDGLGDISQAEVLMRLNLAFLPAPALPVVAGTALSDLLAVIRKGYTIQSERDEHDGFIGATGAAPDAVTGSPAPSAAGDDAKSDDLDDIFF